MKQGSFAEFLRKLPLKPKNSGLHYYNGKKVLFSIYAGAIIDLDVGSKDLQQCADTLIRLYSEYQFSKRIDAMLSFKFTSGDIFPFSDYLSGIRPIVKGSKVDWRQSQPSARDRQSFKGWLDIIYMYAGTASLARDLPKVNITDAQIGDLFISPGFPGHTVMIADMVQNKEGDREILLIEGFTPAMEAHVLKHVPAVWRGVWFPISKDGSLETPVWNFKPGQLHRFK